MGRRVVRAVAGGGPGAAALEAFVLGFGLGPQLRQLARVDLDLGGQLAQHQALEGAVGQQIPQRTGLAGQLGAALGLAQVALGTGRLEQELAQWQGIGNMAGEGVAAVLADEAVGVVLGRQEQEFHAARVVGVGQGGLQRLVRGAAAGGIAVKAEDHGVGETEQFLHVVVGAGRAQGGHGIRKAQLRQGDHVHIAFGDQHVAHAAQRIARLEQAVQLAPLVEQRGFGRVQVFGFFVTQHAPAKTDAFALDVADGEHDAVAEAVVALVVVLADDDQAAFLQLRVVIFREHAGQVAPARRGIAQAVLAGDGARDTALLEVLHRVRVLLELVAVGVAGAFQHVVQGGLLELGGGLALALLRADVLLRHDHADLASQVIHGFHEAHARMLHQKADGIAVLAAAEAVVELLGGADAEGRGLFAVEGAQPHEVGAAFFELHVATHHIDDIDAGQQLLDEGLGNGHGRYCPVCAWRASRAAGMPTQKADSLRGRWRKKSPAWPGCQRRGKDCGCGSVQHQGACALALAGAGGWVAQATLEMAGVFIQFGDKHATALAALGAGQHVGVHELHQAPGAGEGQQAVQLRGRDLLGVQAVGLGQHLDRVGIHALGQVFIDVQEQRAVDVFLPGQEPVGRERQLAFGGRLAGDLLVQADQAFVGQRGFRLQHLHAGTHLDEHGSTFDLLGFVQNTFGGRGHGVTP